MVSLFVHTHLDKFGTLRTFTSFIRNILLKSLYVKKETALVPGQTNKDQEALDNLISLLEENDSENLIDSADLETLLVAVDNTPTVPTTSSILNPSLKKSPAFTLLQVPIIMQQPS